MNEDMSRLMDLINAQIDAIEELPHNSEERNDAVKVLLQLMDREIECCKLDEKWDEAELKNSCEKKLKAEEIQQRDKQLKLDKIRTALDFGKTIISVGAFVLFEVLANKRDLADVIDRDQMHVRKNPFKLKF